MGVHFSLGLEMGLIVVEEAEVPGQELGRHDNGGDIVYVQVLWEGLQLCRKFI